MTRNDSLVGPDGWTYAIHLTRKEMEGLARYLHWIPASRGFGPQYVAEKYPGWGFGELVGVLQNLKLLVRSPHGGPPSIRKGVTGIWISSGLHAHVERD